jgi:hypothetical protein
MYSLYSRFELLVLSMAFELGKSVFKCRIDDNEISPNIRGIISLNKVSFIYTNRNILLGLKKLLILNRTLIL